MQVYQRKSCFLLWGVRQGNLLPKKWLSQEMSIISRVVDIFSDDRLTWGNIWRLRIVLIFKGRPALQIVCCVDAQCNQYRNWPEASRKFYSYWYGCGIKVHDHFPQACIFIIFYKSVSSRQRFLKIGSFIADQWSSAGTPQRSTPVQRNTKVIGPVCLGWGGVGRVSNDSASFRIQTLRSLLGESSFGFM